MVGVTKIQRGNAGYWLAAVAEGGEDYYTKPGEAPGEWVGELAAEMGLSGEVDAAGYTAILEGRHPADGSELLRRRATSYRELPDGSTKRIEAVLGYDVRFSAPKSVSILYALGEEETRRRVVAIMGEAVREGIAHLEREACFVQRGDGGKDIEPGSGFVGMAFRHRMSRAGDPALHVHVVLSNLTRAQSDGRWMSLASPKGRSPLWAHGKSAGVVFQAALRAGFLREFGLVFDQVENGYADLLGFERDLIEAFSTRSGEIGRWLESHGLDSVKAAQAAAYRTRAKKDYGVDEDERRAEWISTAEPFGVSPESIAEMVDAAVSREPRAITEEDIEAALAALEERLSHFDERALLWAICDQLPEGTDLATLTAAVKEVLCSERVVCLHSSSGPLDPAHYTTPRLAELERRFIEGALEGVDAGAAQLPPAAVRAVLDRYPHLGEDQREMVMRLACGGERVIAVVARPGTGKTAALEPATEAWERAGIPVIGCATARSASAELKAIDIPSTSVRSLLNRTDRLRAEGKAPLPEGTVIFSDEATMTSTPDHEGLRFLAVECGGKLVEIGDPMQIGAVGPGGLFATYTRRCEPVRLQTIRRQRREPDRRLVALVHEGRGSEALDLLRSEDRLIVGEDLISTLDGMLADWHRDFATGADEVMIARRNRDVDYLNDRARELRHELGELGESEVIIGERPFAAGDLVQTRINREGALNRERWEVRSADGAARTLELRSLSDGHSLTLGPAYLDRLREDGGPVLEHAYALTIYGAQGKTVDRAFALIDGEASLERNLVALSRGREGVVVYAVAANELLDPDLGPAKRDVIDELQDARGAIEREGADFAAAEVALRLRIVAMSGSELAKRRVELIEAAHKADPLRGARERLSRQIAYGEERAKRLAREREALEAMERPPAEELHKARMAERGTAKRLRRRMAEREALPESDPGAHPAPPRPAERLEAALIERRIEQLARRDVEAARLEPTSPIHEALGSFPGGDPGKARTWQEGAHAISTFRRRYGVSDETDPLGPKPRSEGAQIEWGLTRLRLEQAQRDLGWIAERALGRDLD